METGNVYRIVIDKDCAKSIRKAPKFIRQAVENAFERLSVDPFHLPQVKALSGEWEGYWRYRIGSYRLIYRVDEEIITIFAIAFGSRGDIYK
jgi:mRNA interferase RelE/StbE